MPIRTFVKRREEVAGVLGETQQLFLTILFNKAARCPTLYANTLIIHTWTILSDITPSRSSYFPSSSNERGEFWGIKGFKQKKYIKYGL